MLPGNLCISTQDFKFHLERAFKNSRKFEVWKTIDWNAIVKLSDIFQIYIQKDLDMLFESKAFTDMKVDPKLVDKVAEVNFLIYFHLIFKTSIFEVRNSARCKWR